MRYMTTGGNRETWEAARAFEAEDPENGTFFPAEDIRLPPEEIHRLCDMDFADMVAEILNRFCDGRVTGWNMGLLVGRTPFRVASMNHKIHIAELWHNSGWSFSFLERTLLGCVGAPEKGSLWAKTMIRTAVLWGVYGQLRSHRILPPKEKLDIVVNEGDMSELLGAWYAREMGMPVGNIVCGCWEQSPLWELFYYGQMRPRESTGIFWGLEHLIFCVLGREVRDRFVKTAELGQVFELTEEEQGALRQDFFISVLSRQRIQGLTATLQTENRYALGEETAVSYGALQYSRAVRSEAAPALILAMTAPPEEVPDL